MVLICWVIQILQGKASWRERNPIVVPIILYVLSNILACFIGTINGASFLIMIFRFVRTVFFVYIIFVLINNLKTRRQFEILILILLVCSTLVATYGITQKVIGQTNTEKIAKQVFSKLGVPDSVNYVAGEGKGRPTASTPPLPPPPTCWGPTWSWSSPSSSACCGSSGSAGRGCCSWAGWG